MSSRILGKGEPLTSPERISSEDEVLHHSERGVVLRRRLPDGETSVIIKRAIGGDPIRRLRHERSILERLADVDGVAKLALGEWGDDILALRDNHGVTLGRSMANHRFAIDEVLQFAQQLTTTLVGVHKAGVVHKDINPSNLLLCGPRRRPVLIDFNIATAFSEERTAFSHENHIAGTMAYMAPEQTGRTGRSVDCRSDLYSLGVILFQLVAGRALFESDDLLELLHHQLTTRPPALVDVAPDTPPVLSDLVLRLLEKEPDRRYQTAEGLLHDIDRLIAARSGAGSSDFTLGERDFAAKLMPPSRLVGRERESAFLEEALHAAKQGQAVCLFVSGAPGSGKTALVQELRSALADTRGWFVSGQFDPDRHDRRTATVQALRSLGRLLLAEPEKELAVYRSRLLDTLGSDIDAGITLMPEFALLLGGQRERPQAEPLQAERRMVRAAIAALGCVASRERPLVMVLDDLHQATDVSVRFIDMVIASRNRLPGLMLVLTVQPDEVAPDSLLGKKLEAWRQPDSQTLQIALDPLDLSAQAELMKEMLRLAPDQSRRLAAATASRTRGNPLETIEFINALRADGLLSPGPDGWQWDDQAVGRYVGCNDGVDLLGKRLDKLPPECVGLMEAMACLGGEISCELLDTATGVAEALSVVAPALEDALVEAAVDSQTVTTLRLRNSRLEECLQARLAESGRELALRLSMARRLIGHAEYETHASRQYLGAIDGLSDSAERRRVVLLLESAAKNLYVTDYTACDSCLRGAIKTLQQIETPEDADLMRAMLSLRHQALYALARFEEVDEVYATIASRCSEPLQLAPAAGVQAQSLCQRQRWQEALQFSLTVLARLGIQAPEDMKASLGPRLVALRAWALGDDKRMDFDRDQASDPKATTINEFLKRALTAAFVQDKVVYTWLTLEAHRLWTQGGPSAALMPSIAGLPLLLLSTLSDYRAAYEAGRHAIAVGTHRGYEAGTAHANVLSALCATHWGERMESVLSQSQVALEGLLKMGDLHYANITFGLASMSAFECASTLEQADAYNLAGIEFDREKGESRNAGTARVSHQLHRALRGETASPTGFGDGEFDEAEFLKSYSGAPTVVANFHVLRGLSALIMNDMPMLRRHAADAMAEVHTIPGFYVSVLVYLEQGIAQAHWARHCSGDEREAALAELDKCCRWMTARGIDAPMNFAHLGLLLEAERAWTLGDPWRAGELYEKALEDLENRMRPWHKALILERAARLFIVHGRSHTGHPLLTNASRAYDTWGAAGKVKQLMREFPFLRTMVGHQGPRTSGRSTIMSTDLLDMMAVLRASQAISSETSLTQLNERINKVLSAICGAESVLLVTRQAEQTGWFLADSLEAGTPVSIEEAALDRRLPLSAFRFTERTREALLVDDAVRDHRFSSDPALVGAKHCSLLLVPVIKSGDLRAVLVMQHRTRHGAFSADRLDAVSLIAGQLAVSLDNALLYASLERKVAERTSALADANQQLEHLSVTDALTGLANRRHFNQSLEAEWQRATVQGTSFCLAMIDIDQFKQYNDHYGHHGGDNCLKLVAETMKSALRVGADRIARYGGEEFVLLLRDADIHSAHAVAERVRAAVAARAEPHVKAMHGVVTVSIGLAECDPARYSSATACLELADAALYLAKQSGRNRVMRHGTPAEAATLAPRRSRGAEAPAAEQCLSLVSARGDIGFVRWNSRRSNVFLSNAAYRILHWRPGKSLRLSELLELVHPQEQASLRAAWHQAMLGGESKLDASFTLAADPARHIRASAQLSFGPSSRLTSFLIAVEDVSHQVSIVKALSESQDRLREAQGIARLVYWEWNYATQQSKFSPGALRMLRRPEGWQPTAQDLRDLPPEDQREWIDRLFAEAHGQRLPTLRYETHFLDAATGVVTHLHTVAKFEYAEDGSPARLIATVQDVSEVKGYRRQLHSLSFFDPLTNLPNRAQFVERLREACTESARQNRQLGLLILDVDRFKDINDSLGHRTGDVLLQQVAERLGQVLRGNDTVSRLGGDEFAVVLAEIRQPADMSGIAHKVLGAFDAPFNVGGKEVFVSSSMGGALYPAQAQNVDQLLQFADAALYHAKAQGRKNFQFYTAELTHKAAERVTIEGDLHRGLERGEFELYFQPKLKLSTGKLVGAEALMRWNHPTKGMVPPNDFIPLAEETGLIVPMGAWAIHEACRRAAQWNARGGEPLKVAVNLSARQLMTSTLAKTIRDALSDSACRPEWLELEITESLLLDGRDEVRALLCEIADMGIAIAIDDFGIGYSALSYLTRFPIHILKIDRSFVQGLTAGRSSAELVKAIVSLGKSLGMELVAEGVETPEQAAFLGELGCHTVQGFLYGKPVPEKTFSRLMVEFDSSTARQHSGAAISGR